MLYFSDRLKIVAEYDAWVEEENNECNAKIARNEPMNVLAFLQVKGYLNDNMIKPQEGKPIGSEFALFESVFGGRALIKKEAIQSVEEIVRVPEYKRIVRIVYNAGGSARIVPVSGTFEETMDKFGLSTIENKLHEPSVNIYFDDKVKLQAVKVTCTVCGEILKHYCCAGDTEVVYSNYCPTCGARLKEVK